MSVPILQVLAVALVFLGMVLQFFMLPGVVIQFLVILLFALFTRFSDIHTVHLFIFGLLAIVSGLIDNVANLLGAKKFGASKWGVFGAVLGGLIALLSVQLWAILIFPFIGAVIFELLFDKKQWEESLRSGFGTLIGFLTGYLVKVVIAVVVLLWFLMLVMR